MTELAEDLRAHQHDLNLPEIDTIELCELDETQTRGKIQHSKDMYDRLIDLHAPFEHINQIVVDPQGTSAQCVLC